MAGSGQRRTAAIGNFPAMRKAATALAILLAAAQAGAELYVYPVKEQTAEQQERDEFECYTWARKRTGFDPMKAPEASAPPPATQTSGTSPLRGAARGAATGAVVGAIAGDAGKGAAGGAVGGAMIGGMRRRNSARNNAQAQEAYRQSERANYQARRGEYDRAWGACLEARGYTVR